MTYMDISISISVLMASALALSARAQAKLGLRHKAGSLSHAGQFSFSYGPTTSSTLLVTIATITTTTIIIIFSSTSLSSLIIRRDCVLSSQRSEKRAPHWAASWRPFIILFYVSTCPAPASCAS